MSPNLRRRRRRPSSREWSRSTAAAVVLVGVVWMRGGGVRAEDGSNGNNSNSNALFVLCTADGSIYSIDAWTGEFRSLVLTGPPLLSYKRQQTSLSGDEGDDVTSPPPPSSSSSSSMMFPGLDGTMYWDEDGDLQALPLSVEHILEHPVRSCDPRKQQQQQQQQTDNNCGILTASARASLIAVDAHGKLAWNTLPGESPNPADSCTARPPTQPQQEKNTLSPKTVILQRKEYLVQEVAAGSGNLSWEATLGVYQALEFDTDDDNDDDDAENDSSSDNNLLLPQHGDSSQSPHHPLPELPGVVFTNAGRTLSGVDPESQFVLWQIDTPAVVASLFGMQNGQWNPVQVLAANDVVHAQDQDEIMVPQRLLPSSSSETNFNHYNNGRIDYSQLWVHQQMRQAAASRYPDDNPGLLPSPEFPRAFEYLDDPAETTATTRRTPQKLLPAAAPGSQQTLQSSSPPQGLWISWTMVTGLTAILLAVAIGARLWYVRKRQEWTLAVRTAASSADPERPDDNVAKIAISNTNSPNKSDGPLLTTEASTAAAASSPNYNNNNLPLVRYSRYLSEFEEISALGKGGFGTVFQCKNSLDSRHYAIKKILIRGKQTSFRERLDRVLREVKILAVLDHPHIVRYYTAWLELEDDEPYNNNNNNNEPETTGGETLTRRYSSSLLTDLTTEWNNNNIIINNNNKNDAASKAGFGRWGQRGGGMEWSSSTLMNSTTTLNNYNNEPSFRPPPTHYFRDVSDCGFIFEEDSQAEEEEVGGDTTTDHPVSRDNSRMESSRIGALSRGGGQTRPDEEETTDAAEPEKTIRHMLYIQMQLCKQETVSDFLTDPVARQATSGTPQGQSGVDIPKALGLFSQICQAVQHVHARGLIHRDLKPLNCFMDESGNVKVGDFGLSRESAEEKDDDDDDDGDVAESRPESDDDHTAGVGTRSYASPEQMSGSDYDSSSDVYSLGIILFELCYPMYTGMERNICLSKLRSNGTFPQDWDAMVGLEFPSLKPLILSMVDASPTARPTAVAVAQHMGAILGEFTIQSLDVKNAVGALLLRVEAEHQDDALQNAIQCIQDISSKYDGQTEVIQYGLRSSARDGVTTAVMEFALKSQLAGHTFVQDLVRRPEVFVARQISSAS